MGTEFLIKNGSRAICSLSIIIKIITFTFCLFLLSEVSHAVIKVVDFRGKTIILNRPADRVVCLIESALSGIYMLQQGGKIVGIPTNVYSEGFYYSDTFKYYSILDERIRLRKIPAVGNWEYVNVEKILVLKPDLVIIWASQKDAIETFEKLKIPVYGVFITKIEDVFKEINDFGKMLNAEKRAAELIAFAKKEIKEIEDKSKEIRMKRKIYFSWAQHSFLQTSCKGSIVDEIIDLIGGINVCSHIKAESISLTMEKFILLNPDVIIMWFSKNLKPQDIFINKQYRVINAVKTKSIYQFDDTFFFDLWTLKFLYAMKFIASVSYPEHYKYDLIKEKQRIINFLYGKNLI